MTTRQQIIHSMCLTFRHDYGLDVPTGPWPFREDGMIGAGMTDAERQALWSQMAQIFDNNIEPFMKFKNKK